MKKLKTLEVSSLYDQEQRIYLRPKALLDKHPSSQNVWDCEDLELFYYSGLFLGKSVGESSDDILIEEKSFLILLNYYNDLLDVKRERIIPLIKKISKVNCSQ